MPAHYRVVAKQVAACTGTQAKGILAGCLWLASKHEECRRSIPAASRLSMVVGLSPAQLNALELAVLAALGWNPLAGWDDCMHSKGQKLDPQHPLWSVQA